MTRPLAIAALLLLWLASFTWAQAPAANPQAQLRLADNLRERIVALGEQGDYAAAVPHAEQVVQICREVLGNRHDDTATALNNLGYNLSKQRDYAAAQPPFEEALAIRRQILGEMHERTVISYNQLIDLHAQTQNYPVSQDYQERVLAIRKRMRGPEHLDVAAEIRHLGQLLKLQGKYTQARDQYIEALRMYTRLGAAEDVQAAITQNNLGLVLYELGDYAVAQTHLQNSLRIMRRELGEEHHYTASLYQSVGYVINIQGDGKTARPYYERALAIRLKVLGEDDLDTANSYHNLALLLDEEGEYDAAKRYYERALAIHSNVLGEEHPDTLVSLNNLGTFFADQGEYAEAQDCYERALATRRKVLGDEHPDTANTQLKLGELLADQGDYAAARPHFEQSLAIRQRTFGNDHPDTVRQLYQLLLVEAAENRWPQALEVMEATQRGLHGHVRRVLVGMSPQEQLRYLNLIENYWRGAFSLGLVRREEQAFLDASAGWLLNSKGLAQEILATRELLLRDFNDPQSTELARQLIETRQKLANLAISVPEPSELAARKAAVEELTQAEQALNRQLAQRVGAQAQAREWVELEAIRAALAADDVLINFARFDVRDFSATGDERRWQPARYVAWMIPPAGKGNVRLVDLGWADEIDALIDQARQAMRDAAKPDGPLRTAGEVPAEQQLREVFKQLTARIWQPLAAELPDETARVTLSPDGALWLLPWSGLPLEKERYLIEDFALRLVISGRELLRGDDAKISTSPPLVFADPAFDLTPQQTRQAVQAIFKNFVFGEETQRGLVSQTAMGRVAALPFTRLEALAITPSVEQITGQAAVNYLGNYALESVVKRVNRPSLLVLSTHGFFLPDQKLKPQKERARPADTRSAPLVSAEGQVIENPLLRCGLMLAGCNQPDAGGDDGILTGMEIVGLNLRGTKLVVLSACETGVGQVRLGEGVAGLRQAFQLAGAEGVVSTLWQVPDRDSAILIKDFFENLAQEQSPAEALRGAQLARIASRRERHAAAHPYFWAAWTVTGSD